MLILGVFCTLSFESRSLQNFVLTDWLDGLTDVFQGSVCPHHLPSVSARVADPTNNHSRL